MTENIRKTEAASGVSEKDNRNDRIGTATEQSLKLARERTEWALVRTRLAKERTFNAWLRTGLSIMGAGIVTTKLLSDFHPQWLLRTLSVLFVVVGGLIIGLGLRTYFRVIQQVEKVRVGGHPFWYILTLALLLMLAAIVSLVFVLL